MTESLFIKKIHVLFDHLIKIYYDGEEIDGDVRTIELLCYNFIEIKKMQLQNKNNLNGG